MRLLCTGVALNKQYTRMSRERRERPVTQRRCRARVMRFVEHDEIEVAGGHVAAGECAVRHRSPRACPRRAAHRATSRAATPASRAAAARPRASTPPPRMSCRVPLRRRAVRRDAREGARAGGRRRLADARAAGPLPSSRGESLGGSTCDAMRARATARRTIVIARPMRRAARRPLRAADTRAS